MTINYDALSTDALAAIVAAGGVAIPISRYSDTPNITTGAVTRVVASSGALRGINLPASKGTIQAFDNRGIDKEVLARVRFFLAAAKEAPFEPKTGDEFTWGGETFRIVGCTPLNPTGTALLYKFGAEPL